MWNIRTWFLCYLFSTERTWSFSFTCSPGPVNQNPLKLLLAQVSRCNFVINLHRMPLQRMLRDSKAIRSSLTHPKESCSPQTTVLNHWSENWDPTGKSSRMLQLLYMLLTISSPCHLHEVVKKKMYSIFADMSLLSFWNLNSL